MTKSRRDVGVERMGTYMLSGMVLTDTVCRTPNCKMPTFRSKDRKTDGFCCLCDDPKDPLPVPSEDGAVETRDQAPADDDEDIRPPPVSATATESDRVSGLLGQKLLAGWTMLSSTCPKCNITPLMEKSGISMCCKCGANPATAVVQPAKYSKITEKVKIQRESAKKEEQVEDTEEEDEEFWNELLESAPPAKQHVQPAAIRKREKHSSQPPAASVLQQHMESLTLSLTRVGSNYAESKAICEAIKSCAEAIEKTKMYTLFSGLYEMYHRKEDYYVIILGLDNAGKTTLLERIKSTYASADKAIPIDKIAPTVGLNIGTIDMNATCINFWDLGGQHELRRLWKRYYAESHAVLFVVDACDFERIEEAKEIFGNWLQMQREVQLPAFAQPNLANTTEQITENEELEGVPLLLLANKSDRPESVGLAQLKDVFNPIASKLGARDSKVMSVSALKGEGVRDAIDWLNLRLERNRANKPPILRPL
ncbi:ADP-ribosylation factor protein 3 [Podochytrium sp. JEL0797]|nr:ADP-ribosylation factor protein 3 [Podochytrium sp. JEL0797]